MGGLALRHSRVGLYLRRASKEFPTSTIPRTVTLCVAIGAFRSGC